MENKKIKKYRKKYKFEKFIIYLFINKAYFRSTSTTLVSNAPIQCLNYKINNFSLQ